MKNAKKQRGFTLVELSIVLVIIGLLISGIMAGTAMVKQSKLSSVISDAQAYRMAIINFKNSYNYLPGDFPFASTYWPELVGQPNDGNGNGNGFISAYQNSSYEDVFVWYHLSLAKMVAGSYKAGPVAPNNYVLGQNTPASKYAPGGYQVYYTFAYQNGHQNYLQLGAIGGNGYVDYSIMPPDDAYYIDLKYDDGKPATGSVITQRGMDHNTDPNYGLLGDL